MSCRSAQPSSLWRSLDGRSLNRTTTRDAARREVSPQSAMFIAGGDTHPASERVRRSQQSRTGCLLLLWYTVVCFRCLDGRSASNSFCGPGVSSFFNFRLPAAGTSSCSASPPLLGVLCRTPVVFLGFVEMTRVATYLLLKLSQSPPSATTVLIYLCADDGLRARERATLAQHHCSSLQSTHDDHAECEKSEGKKGLTCTATCPRSPARRGHQTARGPTHTLRPPRGIGVRVCSKVGPPPTSPFPAAATASASVSATLVGCVCIQSVP